MDGRWATISNGTDHWFAKLSDGVFDEAETTYTVTEYIHRGSTEVQHNEGANAPWGDSARIVFGAIPSYFRAYFDLGTPTRNKRATELWVTAANVTQSQDSTPFTLADELTSRYYPNFDETSEEDFTLASDKTLNAGNTNVWVCKNAVPSLERKQFGLEIAELGIEEFTLYNATIKVSQTS
jgi:hypothetical protein